MDSDLTLNAIWKRNKLINQKTVNFSIQIGGLRLINNQLSIDTIFIIIINIKMLMERNGWREFVLLEMLAKIFICAIYDYADAMPYNRIILKKILIIKMTKTRKAQQWFDFQFSFVLIICDRMKLGIFLQFKINENEWKKDIRVSSSSMEESSFPIQLHSGLLILVNTIPRIKLWACHSKIT